MPIADPAFRFIEATERIKSALERTYGRQFQGMKDAIRHAREQRHPVVQRHWRPLQLLGDLRNVMQHNGYLGGQPVATPREDAVAALEKIAVAIERPAQVKDHMTRHVSVLTPTTTLAEASRHIIEFDLSQLPVYDQDAFVGLFTTNALARWLSASIDRNEGLLIEEAAAVGEVLNYAEDYERPGFVRPTESAFRACDRLLKEKASSTLLVTTDGTPAGQLQGIMTRHDVPLILGELVTSYP